MRISSLMFQGFGPYKDAQFIDFDQLGSSGLYLINGPTGAGKTTIIDAICYALYGRLTGNEKGSPRLRSDFCERMDVTRVELIFESAAGRFHVERGPEYVREKERGEGYTEEKAFCKVHEVLPSGEERSIATQVSSANKEIADRVSLTLDQFVQTVVLPQGKFANFLNADTSDREAILKSIFNTGLYERVADILKERTKAVDSDLAELGRKLDHLAQQLGAVAAVSAEEQDVALQLVHDRLDQALHERIAGWEIPVARRYEIAKQGAQQVSEAFDSADASRVMAKDEAAACKERDEAKAAAALSVSATAVAHQELGEHRAALDSLEFDLETPVDASIWNELVSEAGLALAQLKGVIAEELEVNEWPEQSKSMKDELGDLNRKCERLTERQKELPKLISAQEAIQEKQPKPEDWQALNTRKNDLEKSLLLRTELSAEELCLKEFEKQLQLAKIEVARTARAVSDGILRYRSGSAAELASDLEAGKPCAVCGSTEHPQPAQLTDDAISYQQFEELQMEDRKALARFNEAVSQHETALNKTNLLRSGLATTSEEETAEQEAVDALSTQLTTREQAKQDADEELKILREEQQTVTEDLSDTKALIAQKEQFLKSEVDRIEKMSARVSRSKGSFPSVSERRDALQALETTLKQLVTSLHVKDLAQQRLEAAESKLAGMPDRDGFADVQGAEDQWREAKIRKEEADEAQLTARLAHESFTKLHMEIREVCDQRAAIVSSNEHLFHLSDIINAGRGTDYGLHIYVLRAMFETVMALANQRFQSLLNGRYRLVTADDAGDDKRKRLGLGVAVEDALTGKVRSAKSLSGGETFCASLALALGLSDAVRMNAGGIQIDSLFIDEGFGSLDSDQLDEVMSMLNHLSANGRRVGLISHVDSMKESIVERIDVHPARKDQPTSLSVSWMQ